jgi:hypothetical protein
MNVTREVINDLWPVYAAGEASADTRALVEAFLRDDPEFASLLRGRGEEGLLRHDLPKLPPDREAQALRKTKRHLRGWSWLMFLAILFSCSAFGRIISDTSWDVSPVNFIVTAAIAVGFWIAFIVRLLWVRAKWVAGARPGPNTTADQIR